MQGALEAESVSLLHKLHRQQLHVSALQPVTTPSSLAVRKLYLRYIASSGERFVRAC